MKAMHRFVAVGIAASAAIACSVALAGGQGAGGGGGGAGRGGGMSGGIGSGASGFPSGVGSGSRPGGGDAASVDRQRGPGGVTELRSAERQGRSAGELLQQNTRLADNLRGLLPENANLQAAAEGFRNLGQFVAAVHVSHNLGIPFADLKAQMTGENAKSLGEAIRTLRPSTDELVESRRARAQAEETLGGG